MLGALTVGYLTKAIGRRGLMFIAFVFLIWGVFLIGTSPLLGIRDETKIIFVGSCIVGLMASAITIPVLPEMLDQIIKRYPALADSPELNDVTAGYFNGCLGIGEAIGPIVSSLLVQGVGFRSAADILALTIFVYTLFFFIFNGRSDMFTPEDTSEDSS